MLIKLDGLIEREIGRTEDYELGEGLWNAILSE